MMIPKTLQKLRIGEAFQFKTDGVVFVRCRGGFRPGCGGPLYAMPHKTLTVILYGGQK